MKAETIKYRNKFKFVIKWQSEAITHFVKKSLMSDIYFDSEDISEFKEVFEWEWGYVSEKTQLEEDVIIMLTVIAADQLIKHGKADNYACKPGLN